MDIGTAIQLALTWGPKIKEIIDIASSNRNVVEMIMAEAGPIANALENLGAELFPKVAPELRKAAAAFGAFDPNVTKWLQGSLNLLLDPTPNLRVDGVYGPLTRAAVERAQQKLGLERIDGFAGQLTRAAIDAAMSKLFEGK